MHRFLLLLLWTATFLVQSASTSSPSLYSALGVKKSATQPEIKKAYRRAALRCHPDKVPPERREDAEKKFKRVAKAYEILGDESKRKTYDMYGEDAAGGGGGGAGGNRGGNYPFGQQQQQHHQQQQWQFDPGGGISLADLLGKNFGASFGSFGQFAQQQQQRQNQQTSHQRQRQRQRQRQQTKTIDIACTLAELTNGTTKRFKFTHGQAESVYVVDVKPGWRPLTKISFKSRRVGRTSMPPTVFVIKEVVPSYYSVRGKYDIVYSCPLMSLTDIINGRNVEVPMIDGTSTIRIDTRAGYFEGQKLLFRNGFELKLENRGIKHKQGRGHFFVRFNIR